MAYKKIAYVKHPVTPAQKEELNGQGFRIVDLRYKPEEIAKGDKVVDDKKK